MISATTISPLNRRILDGGAPPFSFGNALQADGVNDYTSSTNFDYTSSGNFTINFWYYLNSSFNTNNPYIFGHGSSNRVILLGNSASNRDWRWSVRGSITSFDRTVTGIKVEVDTWKMLTLVKNGNVFKLYKDAIEIDSININVGTITITTPLILFKHPTVSAAYWEGKLDEFAIWNTNLTPTQTEGLFSGNNGDFATNYSPANLLRYYRMNGVALDSEAVDEQGNGNAVLNNFDTATCWVAH